MKTYRQFIAGGNGRPNVEVSREDIGDKTGEEFYTYCIIENNWLTKEDLVKHIIACNKALKILRSQN